MDCSALLTRQLVELSVLVSRLQAARREPARNRLFRDLSNRAVLHVLSRERLMLPAWQRVRWKGLPSEAMMAHMSIKRALAELLVLRPDANGFAEALAAFAAAVERQQVLDREQLVPALRAAMDVSQRRALCNEIELLFDSGTAPEPDALAVGADGSPRELIEQAEVVLSSLSRGLDGSDRPAPAT